MMSILGQLLVILLVILLLVLYTDDDGFLLGFEILESPQQSIKNFFKLNCWQTETILLPPSKTSQFTCLYR